MDSKFVFIILLSLIIYTLYWTWFNDFGIFLLITIFLLTGFLIYNYIDNKIIHWENKIIHWKNKFHNVIDEQIQNINNIKSNIIGEPLTNLKNLKSNLFN